MAPQRIIMLSGQARSGKDTVAEMLKSHYPDLMSIAFAKKLKEYSKQDFGQLAKQVTDLVENFAQEMSVISYKNKGMEKLAKDKINNLIQELCTVSDDQWFYGKKNLITRNILQLYGTEVVRKRMEKENYWINIVVDIIKKSKNKVFVIPDWRFKNEYNIMKDEFMGKLSYKRGIFDLFAKSHILTTVRVESNREGVYNNNTHISERDLDGFEFDYIIHNNGTLEDLKGTVSNLVKNFK